MKKKTLLMLVIFALSLMIVLPVFAGTPDPVTMLKVKGVEKEFFFANGTPITIVEREDSLPGATIKWDGGSVNVGPDAYIYGGMHNDSTVVSSTSITMKGGTVRNIFGGGLHTSNTTTTNVVIEGGKVTSVMGGACDGITTACGCVLNTEAGSQGGKTSTCKVTTTNVTIKGGTISSLVYGGGEAYSYTGTANVTISGGDLSSAWVTAAGSHGYTGKATLNITGGNLNVVQTVNRGTLEETELEVTGGTIKKLYVGGETEDSSVTGTITKSVTATVKGNAKVEEMQLGTSGGQEIDVTTSNVVKAEDIVIADGTVENMDDLGNTVTPVYQVKIDGTVYLVEEGKTIKDIPEYNNIIKKEGYKFIGFEWAQGKWDETTKIDNNYELKTVFEKIEEPVVEDTEKDKEDEKDETPKTGVETTFTVFTVLAVVSLAGLALVKKSK